MFEEIKNIKTGKKELKSFGLTIGIIILVIAVYLFYKNNQSYQSVLYVTLFFIGSSLIIPAILKPPYLIWMTFAILLGWVMTRIILSILFYSIITVIGFLAKIFGEDFLNLKISNHDSYWNLRDRAYELNQDYEKQY